MSSELRAELSLIAIAAVWGLTFVVVQDAIAVLPVATFLAYRFLAAAALSAAIFSARLRALGRDGLVAGLWMGVMLAAGYMFQTYGLEHTSASNAGFITGLFVVVTPLMARIVFGRPAGAVAWLAAAVSTLGLFLLSGAGGSFALLGDGLEVLCAIAFSAHILATDRAVATGHDIGALLTVQLAVVGVVSFAIALLTGGLELPRGAEVWWALIITSVVASVLGFFVQSYAQQHAPPARTALILAAEPAFAGLFGWLVGGDRLGIMGWVGAALIIAAIIAVDAVPRLRPTRPLPEG